MCNEMANSHSFHASRKQTSTKAACQGPYKLASEGGKSVCATMCGPQCSAVHIGMDVLQVSGLCGRRGQSRNKRRYFRVRNSCSPADTIRWWERVAGRALMEEDLDWRGEVYDLKRYHSSRTRGYQSGTDVGVAWRQRQEGRLKVETAGGLR